MFWKMNVERRLASAYCQNIIAKKFPEICQMTNIDERRKPQKWLWKYSMLSNIVSGLQKPPATLHFRLRAAPWNNGKAKDIYTT